MSDSEAIAAVADACWQSLCRRDWYTAAKAGLRVERLPAGTLAEAQTAAAEAAEGLARLDGVDGAALDRTEQSTLAFLRHGLALEAGEPFRWLHGFAVTPYMFSTIGMLPSVVFASIDLTREGESDRYLTLLEDLVQLLHVHADRLEVQAAAGWRIAKPALAGTRASILGIGQAVAAQLTPASGRGGDEALHARIRHRIESALVPAFQMLAGRLNDTYAAAAPEDVGLCHLPGGIAAYREWMRVHLGFEDDPAEIHRTGLAEVAQLAAAMSTLRREAFGHNDDESSFHARLRADPRAKAETPECLEAIYRRHLAAMATKLPGVIDRLPAAPFDVRRVDPAMEAGMTFGYYQAPEQSGDAGYYRYNGANLGDRIQLNAASLIFHEILPGHHIHIARQTENPALPAIRRETFPIGGFNEGWAEYAAGLGEELGLFADPYDHYGWLAHQRFVAQRLVVDTGLNALGWSLEQARAYMAANTLEAAPQVESELLRYATDMPGQALCYRLGYLKFRALRSEAQAALGERWDLAEWHEAILAQGSLPFAALRASLDTWVAERLRS